VPLLLHRRRVRVLQGLLVLDPTEVAPQAEAVVVLAPGVVLAVKAVLQEPFQERAKPSPSLAIKS